MTALSHNQTRYPHHSPERNRTKNSGEADCLAGTPRRQDSPFGRISRGGHSALNPFGVRRVLDGGWTSRHTLQNGAGSRLGPVLW